MKERFLKILPLVLTVILLGLISYGQTLQMYFWQDDSALIFKLQHQAEAAGSFGVGLWERSPYQYLVVPFVPFFPLFKLEPFWYFLVGFLGYFLVGLFLFLFSEELLKDKKIAYFVILVFSAGYIGSDIMFRVINSWQTNIGLILSLITMFFYVRFFNRREIKYYFLSLLFFLFTIEAVYIRSHSFIFVIFAIDLLFTLKNLKDKNPWWLILRQFPFWFLFYKWYVSGQSIGANGLSLLFKNLIAGKFEVLTTLFATAGNALIPDLLQQRFITKFGSNSHLFLFILLSLFSILFFHIVVKSGKKTTATFLLIFFFLYNLNKYFYSLNLHWYRDPGTLLAGLVGVWGMIFSFYLSFLLWKTKNDLAIGVLLGYLVLISQIFGYFLQYPESTFGTTHRYLSNPFLGYCLLFGIVFYIWFNKFKKEKLFSVFPLILIIGLNLYFGFTYQKQVVNDRSIPSRNFYKNLLANVPQIEKGSVFYFDIARNPYYERQFGDFFSVGSMPETTALAIYYGVDRYDVSMFTNYDELTSAVTEQDIDLKKVYTFYYGEEGLVNTTDETRKIWQSGSAAKGLHIDKSSLSDGLTTLSPQILDLNIKISPANLPQFPYSFSKPEDTNLTFEDKVEILKYLSERQNYYKEVKATSLSEWRYSEIPYVVDADPTTAWQSHRTRWNEIKDDNVTVDLGRVKIINKVCWTNNRNTLTPTNYNLFVSTDGDKWNLVKSVNGGIERKNGEVIIENFSDVSARYVKMQITKTLTDDSPSISEFEVIESKFKVDPNKALSFTTNPFGDVKNFDEWNTLYELFKPLAKINLKVSTDKNPTGIFIEAPVFIDNTNHNYEIVLPPSGTKLNKIEIMLNFPANMDILSAKVRNISLPEMKRRNLIKTFSVN